jgi:hypothetical protein
MGSQFPSDASNKPHLNYRTPTMDLDPLSAPQVYYGAPHRKGAQARVRTFSTVRSDPYTSSHSLKLMTQALDIKRGLNTEVISKPRRQSHGE